MEISHFTKCECSTHMLEIQKYKDEDEDDFRLSFWHYGHDANARKEWKERLRWCWRILRTGNPWADSIMVSNAKAKEIADFIINHL